MVGNQPPSKFSAFDQCKGYDFGLDCSQSLLTKPPGLVMQVSRGENGDRARCRVAISRSITIFPSARWRDQSGRLTQKRLRAVYFRLGYKNLNVRLATDVAKNTTSF